MAGGHDWRTTAVRNNAEWCDLVCRSHGSHTLVDDDAWTSRERTPPNYPDAVTLVPNPSVPDLLSRIDGSPGCSIKDSFASCDLTDHGFRVLFEAEWIVRTSKETLPAPPAQRWEQVHDAEGLAAWERAWRGDDGPTDLIRAELLDNDLLAILAGHAGDRVVAGAILNRSSTVVGISNFFADPADAAASWSGCLALAGTLFPAVAIVGYESGDALAAARRHGFATVGPLRVWISDDTSG